MIIKKTLVSRFLSRLGIFLMFSGLLFSRFALSVGMLSLLLSTLIGHPFNETWKKFLGQWNLVLLTSLFFLYLITGIYSADQLFFWERMRIALPLFFLPFAFSQRHVYNQKEFNNWLYFFFILMSVTALHSMSVTVYRQHIIEVSKHLTTPINHVRYSLLLAFSIYLGLHLYFNRSFKFGFEKKMVLLAILIQVVCLHYLAVRSGLVGFYVVLVIGVFRYILPYEKKLVNKWALMTAFPILLGCAQLPSFQQEIITTRDSITSYLRNEPVVSTSDQSRLLTIEAGIRLGMENFWIGTGLGDLQSEMQKK